jgi:16S rRNA processing protein RimM
VTRPAPEAPTHLVVGRVLAPWGRAGQVRAEILTDFPERFSRLDEILVGEDHVPYRLQSARLHKGQVVLKLEGVDDPEQASELRGELLYIPTSEAMPLGEDQYYHYQIVGLDVWTDDGRYLGRITDILETGANDVYVVRQDGREVLIPALAQVVQEVDLAHQRMTVTLLPGLVEEEGA